MFASPARPSHPWEPGVAGTGGKVWRPRVSKRASADLRLSRLRTFPAGVTQLSRGRVPACRGALLAAPLPEHSLPPGAPRPGAEDGREMEVEAASSPLRRLCVVAGWLPGLDRGTRGSEGSGHLDPIPAFCFGVS